MCRDETSGSKNYTKKVIEINKRRRIRILENSNQSITGRTEGIKQSRTLQSEAIKLVNEAANKYFVGNAQILKNFETVQSSLEQNTKIIVQQNQDLANIIDDIAGIAPMKGKNNDGKD